MLDRLLSRCKLRYRNTGVTDRHSRPFGQEPRGEEKDQGKKRNLGGEGWSTETYRVLHDTDSGLYEGGRSDL